MGGLRGGGPPRHAQHMRDSIRPSRLRRAQPKNREFWPLFSVRRQATISAQKSAHCQTRIHAHRNRQDLDVVWGSGCRRLKTTHELCYALRAFLSALGANSLNFAKVFVEAPDLTQK